MDCMEYMRTLPDNAFDLAVVDPPYGSGNIPTETAADAKKRARREAAAQKNAGTDSNTEPATSGLSSTIAVAHGCPGTHRRILREFGDKGSDIRVWDVAPPRQYFVELARVSHHQIIWGGNYFDLPPTRCFLVWRKLQIPLEGFSMAPVEYAWTNFNCNARMFEAFSNSSSGKGDEKRFHPTQKPVELYEWIYRHFAKPGDKILDTHLGSGSSRIAAYNLGYDFVGCELDQAYFRLEEERFEAHTAQGNLFLGL